MKIAIFHNYMDNIGGAERVGLTLARELKADFYTTSIDKQAIEKMGFSDINLISIGKIPVNAPWRQQAALTRFRLLNLKDKYDFYIIDGDWALSGAVNHHPNLWYVHSPIREIWDLKDYVKQNLVKSWKRPLFDLWVRYNRHLNTKYIEQVDKIVCNSENTKKRLKKYLNKEATVINPPIETKLFKYKKNGDFWLSVNRLIDHKRIGLQVEAFRKMPEKKLVIVGCYEQSKHFIQYANYIKKIVPENIEILSWVDQNELAELYANCKGLITTSKDEDFGMTAVEAMASGKPVIAPNEGGYKETVLDGITGELINDIDSSKLIEAIEKIDNNPQIFKQACIEQAQKFDTKLFIDKIKQQLI